MQNGNGKIVTTVLAIVLGASTLVSTTVAVGKSIEAGKAVQVEKEVRELERSYTAFVARIDEKLGNIEKMLDRHVGQGK